MNISLLCKWWWRLENEKGIWQDIIKAKYLQHGVSSMSNRLSDSLVWRDLLKIKHIYMRGRKITTRNGRQTLFWKDAWLYDKPICVIAPVLYEWCSDKNLTVNHFLSRDGPIDFDRWLQWMEIVNKTYNFSYENEEDVIS
jgi:hypothetical protein